MPNPLVNYFKQEPKVPGKGSLFASLAVNTILLYVVNNLRYMGIPQLRETELVSCLWAANIFFSLVIIGNFVLLMFRPVWFFFLVQSLINAAGVNVFFFVYYLYPFDLGSSTLDSIVKITLILIMIGFFLAFLIEAFQFGRNIIHFSKKKEPPATVQAPPGSIPGVGSDLEQNPSPGAPPAAPAVEEKPDHGNPPEPSGNGPQNVK